MGKYKNLIIKCVIIIAIVLICFLIYNRINPAAPAFDLETLNEAESITEGFELLCKIVLAGAALICATIVVCTKFDK